MDAYAKRQHYYDATVRMGKPDDRNITEEVLQLRWLAVMGKKKAYRVMAALEQSEDRQALYNYMLKHMPAFADHHAKGAESFTIRNLLNWG